MSKYCSHRWRRARRGDGLGFLGHRLCARGMRRRQSRDALGPAPELANKINMEHCNPDYFPDLPLPAS